MRTNFVLIDFESIQPESLAQQLNNIREGMTRAEIVQIFSEVCWEPECGGLSTVDSMAPRLSALQERLSDPLRL